MTTTTATKTVRELAIEIPSAIRVFESFGLDFCCGGGMPLDEACAKANITVDAVMARIEEAERNGEATPEFKNWDSENLAALIGHIVSKHHSFVRQELPRLEAMLAKITGKHGERRPALRQVLELFYTLRDELTSHLMKEEQILFPYVLNLEAALEKGLEPPFPPFGSVKNPIRLMLAEHDGAGDILKQMRTLTENYSVPEDGCATYHGTFRGLEEFERDLHMHIHLENNVLFPRAVAYEEQ